jgi:hypothetical protein
VNGIHFFLWRNSPLVGQNLLTVEASRSHLDTPLSVGLLWTSDQLVAENSTCQHTTLTRDGRNTPLVGGNGIYSSGVSRPGHFACKENYSRCRINTRLAVFDLFQTDVHKNWRKTTIFFSVPLQAWTGPQGSRRLRPPESWHWHMKVVDCQPYAPAAFTPRINLVLIFRGWVDPRAHGNVRFHGKKTRRHRE